MVLWGEGREWWNGLKGVGDTFAYLGGAMSKARRSDKWQKVGLLAIKG